MYAFKKLLFHLTVLIVVFSSLLLFLIKKKKPTIESGQKELSGQIIDSVVFISKTLQDSLCYFMNAVDSFPNPYGNTIYTITLCSDEPDTLISFVANGLIVRPMVFDKNGLWYRTSSGPSIVGAKKIGEKIVAINVFFENVDSLIDANSFNRDLYDSLTRQRDEVDNKWDGWEAFSSERYYKLVGSKSLIPIKSRFSKYEKGKAYSISY